MGNRKEVIKVIMKVVGRLARRMGFVTLGRRWRKRRIYKVIPFRAINQFLTILITKINPGLSIEIMGHRMFIRPYCYPNFATLLLDDSGRRHEDSAFSLFKSLLKEGMTVVDAGANSGWFTLNACSAVGEQGKVFAFEPDERWFKALMDNIKLNGYTNVQAFQVALTDQVKVNQFVDKVDLINIDVEGSELAVLKGLKGILTWDAKIICEVHPWIPDKEHQEIRNLLISQEFRLSFAGIFEDKEFEEERRINKNNGYIIFADRGKD